MKLKYSIEQLIHFNCPACNYSWTHSGEMPKQDYLCCPMCEESFELDLAYDITTRPLIEAFSDGELQEELSKRQLEKLSKSILVIDKGVLKRVDNIKTNAGMPQRGVK